MPYASPKSIEAVLVIAWLRSTNPHFKLQTYVLRGSEPHLKKAHLSNPEIQLPEPTVTLEVLWAFLYKR